MEELGSNGLLGGENRKWMQYYGFYHCDDNENDVNEDEC